MVWTNEEITAYEPLDYAPLQKLYRDKGLSIYNPEARAKFLVEEVLRLTMTDHDIVMRTAKAEGRASALRLLEGIVASVHREGVKPFSETILPLQL